MRNCNFSGSGFIIDDNSEITDMIAIEAFIEMDTYCSTIKNSDFSGSKINTVFNRLGGSFDRVSFCENVSLKGGRGF